MGSVLTFDTIAVNYSGTVSPGRPIEAGKFFSCGRPSGQKLLVESVKAPLEPRSFTENASL